MRAIAAAFAAAFTLIATAAVAHHAGEYFRQGSMVVSHAWTQETAAMADGNAVYLTIANEGEEADRLIAASASFAHGAIFQAQVLGEDGTLRTVTVPAVEIGPGERVTFQPGGVQIVLTGLQRRFAAGDHFDMELTFANAGTVEVEVEVEQVGHQPHDHDHDEPGA